MLAIREVVKRGNGASICIVRTESYSKTLEYINQLFEVARCDFPTLDPAQADVRFYGGRRFARTYGIEFATNDPVPECYREIPELHETM